MKVSKVGIVIITHDAVAFIDECLTSVINNNYDDFHIVVVDNASTDITREIISRYKKVHLIKNSENTAFAEANNQGIKYLLQHSCDYIMLLNADTVVDKKLIVSLLTPFRKNEQIAITGSVITYYHDPDIIWFGGGYFNRRFCYTRHQRMNSPVDSVSIKNGTTDFITGCCMMIKREIFEKTGFLDTSYGYYFEDLDFCLRAQEKGYLCHLVELPLVKHRVSATSGREGSNILSPFRAYYYARNPFLIIKKHLRGVSVITACMGQLMIRLPYYIFRTKSITAYIKGLFDGARVLL